LALGWEEEEDQMRALSALPVARVRQQANVGVMADAMADEAFARHVVKAIGEKKALPTSHGVLDFAPTSLFTQVAGDEVADLTLSYLERFVESLREEENHGAYLTLIQTLAMRTAELHRAFEGGKSPAFAPEPFAAQDIEAWRARVRDEAAQTLDMVAKLRGEK